MELAGTHRRALGIAGDTCEADIRRRHRALMLRYHPDRAPRGRENEFLRRAQELNAAREWMLSHPSSWVVELPDAPAAQAQVMRSESLSTPTWMPRNPVPPRSAPVAVVPKTRNVGERMDGGVGNLVGIAIVLYLLVLAFAIIGWLLTALLPAVMRVLG